MARPRTISMCSSFLYVLVIISLLGLLSVNTNAQTTTSNLTADLDSSLEAEIPPVSDGQSLCSCSPSTYAFTLDFSLTCPPVNVTRNGGIAATFCQISPFGDAQSNITDLVPVEVGYVDVLELGQAFEVLTQVNITGTFKDGDTIPYTSIASSGTSSDSEIPKVIQLNIFAFNAAGQPIVNFFAIAFSNNCDEYPTLIEGESAGWTQFTKLEPPVAGSCPANELNTNVPTIAPISVDPIDPTTDEPFVAPVDPIDPTEEPTPSFNDTMAPTTIEPSAAPVVADTDEPTEAPVVPVDVTDVPTPSFNDTMAPTTMEPSAAPVVADTDEPTAAPVVPVDVTDVPTPSFNDTMAPTTMEPSAAPVVADTDEPTSLPTVFILPPTDSPIAEDTVAPTPELTMSMDMSMSMDMMYDMDSEFLGMAEMMMSMSMSMSMTMPARGFLRKADIPSKISYNMEKGDKSSKGLKSAKTKSSKGDKEEKKSSKVTKIGKGDTESKVENFFKNGKEPKEVTMKSGKGERGRRRRRLRVHRVD